MINKTFGTAGIYGLKVSNITSIIPQTDFSNIIICFDDLERKSNKIDSKDKEKAEAEIKDLKEALEKDDIEDIKDRKSVV